MSVHEYILQPYSMASQGSSNNYFKKASVIRGQHIYNIIWMPVVGEELALQQEDGNDHDTHAVTVMKDSNVVGHIPLSISLVSRQHCSSYVCKAEVILCFV